MNKFKKLAYFNFQDLLFPDYSLLELNYSVIDLIIIKK